jgi:hypothetical protein
MLETKEVSGSTALSYAFRPLTKNKYVKKNKAGMVYILAKGKKLFPEITPLVTAGGGVQGNQRINAVSRTAMFLREAGVDIVASPEMTEYYCFIPSACWRKIRPGILSTTRFTGIFYIGEHRLATYDIRDAKMEWQLRAEKSLFYQKTADYSTAATGLLLICDDDKRIEVAQKIIRTTMWKRRELDKRMSLLERIRPVKFVRAPIRLDRYYQHVYLTTPSMLPISIDEILKEEVVLATYRGDLLKCYDSREGDYDNCPCRYFINSASDLLKYVYYFSAVKSLISLRNNKNILAPHVHEREYMIILPEYDKPILEMYPDVINTKGMKYEYTN